MDAKGDRVRFSFPGSVLGTGSLLLGASIILLLTLVAAGPVAEGMPLLATTPTPIPTNYARIVKTGTPSTSVVGGTVSYTVTIALGSPHSAVVEDIFSSGGVWPNTGPVVGSSMLDGMAVPDPTLVVNYTNWIQFRFALGNLDAGVHTLTYRWKLSPTLKCSTSVLNEVHLDLDGSTAHASLSSVRSYLPCVTPTATSTATKTPTAIPTETPTSTPAETATPTETPTALPTETPTVTPTPTNDPPETPTATPTETPTALPTETPTVTPTPTNDPPETPTATPTETPTALPTETPTVTPTPTATPTNDPPATPTPNGLQPLTIGYWKNHQSAMNPYLPITVGNVTITTSWRAAQYLQDATARDASKMLFAQLLAAKLNVAAGADSCISGVIAAADAFLIAHPYGSNPQGADRAYALGLKDQLDGYNNNNGCS